MTSVRSFAPDGGATRIETRTVFPTGDPRDEPVATYHAIGRQTLDNRTAHVSEIARPGGG